MVRLGKKLIFKHKFCENFNLIYKIEVISAEWIGNHFVAYSVDHPSLQKRTSCECVGGTCEKGACICHQGFYGDNCEYSKCKKGIPQFGQCNKGTCLKHLNKSEDFKCLCNPDANGALCE